jgi:predicted RNA-binding protein
MKYWLIVTSYENFRYDREILGFKLQGLAYRFRKQVQRMQIGDKVVYYIMKLQKFGAIATILGDYFEDSAKIWVNDDEMWPARRESTPDIVLLDDELIDVKRLVNDLSFIKRKNFWGVFFQGSIRNIPEDDFRLIESEMKKIRAETKIPELLTSPDHSKTEEDYENEIMSLTLQSKTLHDRLGEMLEQIGSWMDYNTQTRHKIIPGHAYELDIAWLSGKNPEIAIEVQISGNIVEAKDRLAQAKKFNYRKLILVIKSQDMKRLNAIINFDPELRNWIEAWSIGAVLEMYNAGKLFFNYFHKLREAVYKDKKELQLIE